jgi:hypothetical protein
MFAVRICIKTRPRTWLLWMFKSFGHSVGKSPRACQQIYCFRLHVSRPQHVQSAKDNVNCSVFPHLQSICPPKVLGIRKVFSIQLLFFSFSALSNPRLRHCSSFYGTYLHLLNISMYALAVCISTFVISLSMFNPSTHSPSTTRARDIRSSQAYNPLPARASP